MHLPTPRFVRYALLALATLPSLGACVYRMNIQQGNYLDPNAVYQLKTGMTRSQVRYLLGTPMMPDAFDENRWDYYYYMRLGRQSPEERRLTVLFEDDKVTRIEKNNVPEPLYIPDPAAPGAPVQAPDTVSPAAAVAPQQTG